MTKPSRKLVLVVDDDADTRTLLEGLVEAAGHTALSAATAEQGFRIAYSYHPDLILLDVNLPDRSGRSVLRELKANERTATIPVAFVTGERGVPESMDLVGVLDKPVSPEALLGTLNRCLDRKEGRVLVVEDSEDDRAMILGFLEGRVEEVRTAANGREALEVLSDWSPDLVLLDLVMPEMDGFDFLRRLRRKRRFRSLPVVVLTGKRLSLEEIRALKGRGAHLHGKSDGVTKNLRQSLQRFLT